jgi:hypothetical protein
VQDFGEEASRKHDLEDLDIGGRIILKLTLKQDGRAWTVFALRGMGTRGGLLLIGQ